jgi:hypothetical protein
MRTQPPFIVIGAKRPTCLLIDHPLDHGGPAYARIGASVVRKGAQHRCARAQRYGSSLQGLQAKYPAGFVIRCLYSVGYVQLWAMAWAALPALRVWGYTARGEYRPDRKIDP